MLHAKEAGVLQDLARQYMESAARPQQRELENCGFPIIPDRAFARWCWWIKFPGTRWMWTDR